MSQRIKFLIAVFVLSLSGFDAGASRWISSGGELFETGRNPWFVRNTEEVTYCLKMDEPSFSISKAGVESLIRSAIDFWKEEFTKNSQLYSTPTGTARIGSQKFLYTPECSQAVSLQFKFGIKTLDEKEKEELQEPRRYIGITIRKDYDPLLMRGHGIIYVSADKGADAYLNSGQLVEEAWRAQDLLKYALIHELGHVFGIPHLGAGLMSEVFMDLLLNKSMAPDFQNEPQQSFLNAPQEFNVCRLTGKFNPDFFQVSKATPCLLFRSVTGQKMTWKVFSADEMKKNPVEAGVVQGLSLETSPFGLKPAVIVQIPAEQESLPIDQRVFRPFETVMGPFLVGAVFSEQAYRGVFKAKGSARPWTVHMNLSADHITFVGTLNGQQMTVLNYSPLTFMRTLFP